MTSHDVQHIWFACTVKVGGMTFTERVDGGTAFLSAAGKCKMGTTIELQSTNVFLFLWKRISWAEGLVLRGKTEYKADICQLPCSVA